MASPQAKAGAAAAVAGIAGAIVLGILAAQPSAGRKHTRVDWDGGVPAGTKCALYTVKASPEALAAFGLTDDGSPYVRARVCAVPQDGGLGLPSGMVAVPDTDTAETDHLPGQPRLEAWKQGDLAAPFPCACSPGSDCEELQADGGWAAAEKSGNTLPVGAFRGTGCVPKPCVELAGTPSMPEECL